MTLPRNIGSWIIIDSGIKTGEEHMGIDAFALASLLTGSNTRPILRFFQWSTPTVSYGYLTDLTRVETWAKENGGGPLVKRPTGGGVVLHQETDLSFSLLWPRNTSHLSENPRTCYAQIHEALLQGLIRHSVQELPVRPDIMSQVERDGMLLGRNPGFELYTPGSPLTTCGDDGQRFSVCFQEPVCNDVMIDGKKVVGGALRITKHAFLYQGHIQLTSPVPTQDLKLSLTQSLGPLLAGHPDLVLAP